MHCRWCSYWWAPRPRGAGAARARARAAAHQPPPHQPPPSSSSHNSPSSGSLVVPGGRPNSSFGVLRPAYCLVPSVKIINVFGCFSSAAARTGGRGRCGRARPRAPPAAVVRGALKISWGCLWLVAGRAVAGFAVLF